MVQMELPTNFLSLDGNDDIFTTDPGIPFHLLRRQKGERINFVFTEL